jgi:hypothetical protein
MKTRQGFVSNSSSSSFIMVLTNDTDKDINIQDWWYENGLQCMRDYHCDEREDDIELEGSTPREMLQSYGKYFDLYEVDNVYLENNKKILKPKDKVYVCIFTDAGGYTSVGWNNCETADKLDGITIGGVTFGA